MHDSSKQPLTAKNPYDITKKTHLNLDVVLIVLEMHDVVSSSTSSSFSVRSVSSKDESKNSTERQLQLVQDKETRSYRRSKRMMGAWVCSRRKKVPFWPDVSSVFSTEIITSYDNEKNFSHEMHLFPWVHHLQYISTFSNNDVQDTMNHNQRGRTVYPKYCQILLVRIKLNKIENSFTFFYRQWFFKRTDVFFLLFHLNDYHCKFQHQREMWSRTIDVREGDTTKHLERRGVT